MTTLVSVPEARYTPSTQTFNVSVPVGTVELVARLTNVSWPAGSVATMSIVWTDGDTSTATVAGGGTAPSAAIGVGVPDGVTDAVVTVQVLQTVRTAITVTATP